MRSTGPADHVRDDVAVRSAGLCERCGAAPAAQIHHRRPRGMGGTRRADTNGYPNLLDLCNACHSWIESYRTAALDDGWLVRQRSDPAAVPVLYRGYQAWLREDGGVDYLTAEEIAARRSAA